jgi:hypothetical protein
MTGLTSYFQGKSTGLKYYAQQPAENETGKVDILVGAFMLCETGFISRIRWI